MTYHRHWTVIERLSSLLSSKQTNCPSRIGSYWMVSSFLITIFFLYYLLLAYWDHKTVISSKPGKILSRFSLCSLFSFNKQIQQAALIVNPCTSVYDRKLSFSTGRNISARSILNTDLGGRLLRNAIAAEAALFV